MCSAGHRIRQYPLATYVLIPSLSPIGTWCGACGGQMQWCTILFTVRCVVGTLPFISRNSSPLAALAATAFRSHLDESSASSIAH